MDLDFIRDAKLAVHGSTGAQLANLQSVNNLKLQNVTWSCKDNVVTAKGTGYSSTNKHIFYNVPIIPGNYYLSGKGNGVLIVVHITENSGTSRYVYADGNFTLAGNEQSVVIYLIVRTGVVVDETIKVMLNKGDTALPFEPYTGGTPYTDKYTATIENQTDSEVTLSIENVSATVGDSTELDVVLTDRNDITQRSEVGKAFIGGESS